MSEGNTYNHFTAADIEKYHRGLLSPGEMHAIEKAALDDPFLADALDGYGAVSADTSSDMAELEDRMQGRISGKVVPMYKRKSLFWFRVAAAVVLVAATGLFVYRFNFGGSSNESVARMEGKKADQPVSVPALKADTVNASTATTKSEEKFLDSKNAKYRVPVTDSNRFSVLNSNPAFNTNLDLKLSDSSVVNLNLSAPVNSVLEKKETFAASKQKDVKSPETDREIGVSNAGVVQRQLNDKPAAKQYYKSQKQDSAVFGEFYSISNDDFAKKRKENVRANFFRGRVMDNNNNAVPFANVTNTRDNVGTYADAQGNFALVSTDSILNVQVHSVGYEDNRALLKNNAGNNLVMQEDKGTDQTVLSNRAFNSNRSREANIKVEEPEPADGWSNYDTYLANNIKVPDDVRMKQSSGHVEVSFEVDKNGDPVNIKVEKSLCDQCDQEAIRLVKEGPKWKRKGKNKKRVTVNVPFNE